MYYNKFINFIDFYRKFGLGNLIYFLYAKKRILYRLPFTVPAFGRISMQGEVLNIRDNIFMGSLRDETVEKALRTAKDPVIVDCGINVGVTVRWWFYLNPRSTVYGIDMMQEAHDFTVKTLPDQLRSRYISITTVLGGRVGSLMEVEYEDPLFGGNSLHVTKKCPHKRGVISRSLDDCLQSYHIDTIDLIKVDIEDDADVMLGGASETFSKVKNILLEVHSTKERENSIRMLNSMGFGIRRTYKRQIWLERESTPGK